MAMLVSGCAGNKVARREAKLERQHQAWLALPEYSTEIMSDPPGARIEVDGNYIGEAPVKYTWGRYKYMYFTDRPHEVIASPTYKGHCVQRKYYNGGHSYNPFTGMGSVGYNDPIPSKIFFTTALCQQTPSVDVNVNKK